MAKSDSETTDQDAQPTAEAKVSRGVKAGVQDGGEGSVQPTEIDNDGTTMFLQDWLILNAQAVLDHPSHVVVGAFHSETRPYLSVDEAKAVIDEWLASPVTTDSGKGV